MKKWWLIGAAAAAAVLWQAGSLYSNVQSGQREISNDAQAIAKSGHNLAQITKTEHFYKNEAFEVVHGVGKDGQKMIVWVDGKGHTTAKSASSGLTEKEMIASIREQYGQVDIIDARIGMEDGQPLWEVVYKDESGRYTFYYGYFENGKRYVKYSIQDKT
ncbi:DUF5590 domain-containing protein [Fictibacillus aquaticus]|uniref:Cell wall elongation regulator TseB-like domain-containing protein n=1 Tax=Fictibacillus aquaticus TaxID=2021314 RepID=A0A235FB51_9BACL|nr:DUF5590 domain-containing protein [Fictibacillus aquaticus]OYD58556.1 hypothetical protein CGZ90_01240 [Fictibacillus aquaticus]